MSRLFFVKFTSNFWMNLLTYCMFWDLLRRFWNSSSIVWNTFSTASMFFYASLGAVCFNKTNSDWIITVSLSRPIRQSTVSPPTENLITFSYWLNPRSRPIANFYWLKGQCGWNLLESSGVVFDGRALLKSSNKKKLYDFVGLNSVYSP